MTRFAAASLLFPAFLMLALAGSEGCATPQDDAPFPHVVDAGAGGAAANAGASGSVSSAGAAAAGAPATDAGAGGMVGGAGAGTGAGMGGAATVGGAGAGGAPSAGSGGATDACPNNPLKTAPGACGCDTTADEEAACQALIAGLAHRYTFAGTGSTIKDTKGTADAAAINLTLANTGNLDFTTGDQYADLPNTVLSTLTNATLEAFVTWQGGDNWQRICDFGEDTSGVENNRSSGKSYVFLSPHGSGNFVRAVYKKADTPELILDATPSLTIGDPAQVALVIDDDHDTLTLYVNGVQGATAAFTDHLSNIHDINNWLGRSQFATDPPFVGNMQEFRIYSVALSAAPIAYSKSKGPDATYLGK